MRQAVFLVTSLSGLRKTTFKNKVTTLVNEGVSVTVLFAMVRFDEFETARRQLKTTLKPGILAQVTTQSLADLISDAQGVALDASEVFQQDFLSLTEKQFDGVLENDQVLRYVKDGEILGEVVKSAEGATLTMTRFSHNEPVQMAIYDEGHMVGLMDYDHGHLTQSLLLNGQDELVYRFIRHERQVNWLYSMGKTSKLQFSNQVPEVDDDTERVVYKESEQRPFYEVIDHVNYHRLGDLYEFYALILRSFDESGSDLFIDLDDNPDLVSYMPQQLIFNY